MKKTIFLFFAAILCAVGMNAYGATQRYIYVGLSNNYHQWKNERQWGINHWGGTGEGVVPGSKITDLETTITHSGCTFHMYRMYVYDDNKNFEFKGNDGWWSCKKEGISISGTTKNALLFRDNADGGSPTFYQTDYKETSTVSLSASAASVSVGEEVTLTPTLTSNAEFNEIKSITYSVGTGATVSTDGKFVATAAGTYTVTATITYNPKHFTGITTEVNNLTCEIVVSEVAVPHPVTGVTVAPTSVTIKQGATATLTATVSPSNADDPSITWSSDNTSVATVVNGVVTAVAAGTANITVTTVDGGFTATCAVKVKPLQYTFYAINSAEWPTVAAHYWEGADGGSAWPGANMVKESETINGFDIYSITISSDFVNIMFTNQIDGDNNKKTADLTTEGNDGKYYDIKDAKWYASLSEVPVSYDYYVIGTINSWGLKDAAYGLELNEDVYEKEVALAIGKHELKINNGTWDNASTFGYDNLSVAYEEVSRGSGEGDNNIVIDLAEAKTITVKLDKNTKKITLEGLTEKAPEPTYDYYLTGSLVGGWGVKQQGIEKDGELYKATFTELNAGTYEFKITAGDWEHQWNYNNLGAAYEEVSQGVDDEGKPNGNIKIVTEEAKNITVIFDATEDKITLEGLTPYVAPLTYTVTVPAGTEKCYIAGAFAQSNWNTFLEMEQVTGEDKFTITITGAKESDEYKYACQADWAYAEVIDGGGNRTNWSELDEVTAWGKPVIVTYQLKGVGGWEQPGIELVQNPDPEKASEYMLTCQAISATDAIKVVRLEGGEIKDYYGNGTVKDGVEVTVNSDNDGNIQLPEGTYNFYFDTAEPEKKLWIAEATDCVTTEEKTIFIEEGLEYSVNGTTVTITGRYNDELFELKISDCDINNLEDQTCPITMSIGEFGANGYIENQNATVAVWFSGYIQVTATGLQDYDNSNITYNIDITAAPSAEEGLSEINVEVYDAVCTINEDNMLTMLSTTAGVQVNVYNFDRTVAMAEYDYVLYTYDGMASGKTNVAIDGNTVSINVETTGEDNDGNEIPVIAFVSGELPAAEEEDPTQPQTMDIKVTDLVVEDNVVTGTGSNFTFVLTLVDYAGEDGTYVLSDESFVRSGMSLRGYAATGSLTKAVDEDYGTYFRGTIQATVGETPFTFNLTMVSEVTKEENIAAAATVTYNEENDVVFSANWNGTPISITLEGFENVAEKQYGELTLSIGTGEDEFYAFGEPIAYVNGKEIRIEGEFYSYITETIYNVALWGTLPDYTRTVTSGNYGTICLPNAAASTTGAIFYRVAGKEEGKVYLESVDALEAGVPYIFEATAGTITVTYQGEAVAEAGTANGLVGTFVETTVPDGDYILYNNAFCTNEPAGTLNKIKENRAYLDMDAVTGGAPQQLPGRRYIGMSVQGENEATGFEDITAPEGQAIKAIINGQLIIIRGGEKYNVQGQKL